MKTFRLSYIAIMLIAGIILSGGIFDHVYSYQTKAEKLREFNDAFTDVVGRVSQAVVKITVKKNAQPSGAGQTPYERFRNPQGNRPGYSLGSGVIFDPAGYIITNNHVVEGADSIGVQLPNKFRFEAKLVGHDPLTDIALLKIEGENLPFAKLGRSEELRVGEWVFAIGSPSNLTTTVTQGIISAIGRSQGFLRNSGNYRIEDFIQTDAAINPGNSGGPLINLSGEVIGINTAIISETGGFQGYGFAVPISLAKNVVNDLRRHGKVVRGILGIQLGQVDDQYEMKNLRLDNTDGVVIDNLTEGVMAARSAGLRVDDVIVKIDGLPVKDSGDLTTYVSSKDPGDKITVTAMRNGRPKIFNVTLEAMPENNEQILANNIVESYNVRGLGINVVEPSGNNRRRGVEVTFVGENSVAKKAGLKEGDRIYKIQTVDINDVADLNRALQRYDGRRDVTFYILQSNGKKSILTMDLRNR